MKTHEMTVRGTMRRFIPLILSLGIVIGYVLVRSSFEVCHASMVLETNFENGHYAPWTKWVTPNGTVGDPEWPTVEPFETVKKGTRSNALVFKVGQLRYNEKVAREQGGGLQTQITTNSGTLHLSVHIAVVYHSPSDKRNLAGGLFQWIVDGHVIASHEVGPIINGSLLRHFFQGQQWVPAGVHTIRLRITRPYVSHSGQYAPFQYLDNLRVQILPPPE